MNYSVIPDITLQGSTPERAHTLTTGNLAALVRDVAARPAYWWHLARFDGEPVLVEAAHDLWLTAWPPGHRADPGAAALVVLAGELSERTLTGQGVAVRTLRANRIRVYGTGDPRELHNQGPGYALSLHAISG
jgi:hypothetical protein